MSPSKPGRSRNLPVERDITSACTFWRTLSDLCAEMLNEVKCAKIFWHSIQERSSRCLSSDASSVGDKYPTMTAKPAVKASVIRRLALFFF
jgi:hypothetical protein